eukprot:scaffold43039_cov22-Tisochrysis_lutea.AAC.1
MQLKFATTSATQWVLCLLMDVDVDISGPRLLRIGRAESAGGRERSGLLSLPYITPKRHSENSQARNPQKSIPPGKAYVTLIACTILCARAWMSWSALAAVLSYQLLNRRIKSL